MFCNSRFARLQFNLQKLMAGRCPQVQFGLKNPAAVFKQTNIKHIKNPGLAAKISRFAPPKTRSLQAWHNCGRGLVVTHQAALTNATTINRNNHERLRTETTILQHRNQHTDTMISKHTKCSLHAYIKTNILQPLHDILRLRSL